MADNYDKQDAYVSAMKNFACKHHYLVSTRAQPGVYNSPFRVSTNVLLNNTHTHTHTHTHFTALFPGLPEWWDASVVICLERGADLHTVQLMSLSLTVSCFSKIQIGFTFLVLAHIDTVGWAAGRASGL